MSIAYEDATFVPYGRRNGSLRWASNEMEIESTSDGSSTALRDALWSRRLTLKEQNEAREALDLLLVVRGAVLAVSQIAVVEGSRCRLEFHTDAVFVRPDPPIRADLATTIPYGEVTSLHVGGKGSLTSTSGGGWIGGGFGVEGMIEGAAIASVMNALTTRRRTTIETLVELSAGPRALILLNETEAPDSVRVHLAPVLDRIELAHSSSAPRPSDRLAQLKQLGELRDAGILTESEFQAEKARILAS
jgi:hypothetical protein